MTSKLSQIGSILSDPSKKGTVLAYLSEEGLRQNTDVRQGIRGDLDQPERTPDHGAALSDEKNGRFFSVAQGDE